MGSATGVTASGVLTGSGVGEAVGIGVSEGEGLGDFVGEGLADVLRADDEADTEDGVCSLRILPALLEHPARNTVPRSATAIT